MVALKYLMVGITNHLQLIVYKSFMNGCANRNKIDLRLQIRKNTVQSF